MKPAREFWLKWDGQDVFDTIYLQDPTVRRMDFGLDEHDKIIHVVGAKGYANLKYKYDKAIGALKEMAGLDITFDENSMASRRITATNIIARDALKELGEIE